MSTEREFDVLVFGATGLVGRHVTEYLLSSSSLTSWAICGRSRYSLTALLARLRAKHTTATTVPSVLVADALGAIALLEAAVSRAHVVINCAGPYARLGSGIVSACVMTGTHYVDVSGEPEHLIRSTLDHNAAAISRGVLVVPACAFSHAIADATVAHDLCTRMRKDARKNGVARPKMVAEMFMRLSPGSAGYRVGTGTLDSTLCGVLAAPSTMRMEKALPAPESPREAHPHRFRFGIYREERLRDSPVVCVLDGEGMHMKRVLRLVDAAVIGSDGLPGSDELAFRSFMVLGTWLNLAKLVISILLCALIGMLPGGRAFVLRHAKRLTWGFFGAGGPSHEQIKDTSVDITLFGRWNSDDGAKSGNVVVQARLPEPTYTATSRIAVAAAITILEERMSLPKGGVLPPAFAFKESGFLERMQRFGAIQYIEE